jgi:hypothetical protein
MLLRLLMTLILALTILGQTNVLHGKEAWAPDFIIIGAQKGGTTALREFIIQHPQVVLSKKMEVHFFDKQFAKGIKWYRNQFPKRPSPYHLIGEKTPYYMFHPAVPKRIFSFYPKVKIIIILRNPVDRAYSHYQMNKSNKTERLSSFEEAIEAESNRLAGEEKKLIDEPFYHSPKYQSFSYLKRGIYVDQIQRWLDYFPREQILILTNEDLNKDPQGIMNTTFAFLGISPCELIQFEKFNARDYEPMDPATRQKLIKFFRPYNKQLQQLLKNDFHWDK